MNRNFYSTRLAEMLNSGGKQKSVFVSGLKCFVLSLALGAACLFTVASAEEGAPGLLPVSASVYRNISQYDSLTPYEAYVRGKAALDKNDPEGCALLESSARRGCNHAMIILADYFLPVGHPLKIGSCTAIELEGRTLDGKERLRRYLQLMNGAAENGSAFAAKELADIYRGGRFFGKDADKLFKYTELAALAGEPESMYWLGSYCAWGLGCRKDRAAAVRWMKRAAQADNVWAKNWIADRTGSCGEICAFIPCITEDPAGGVAEDTFNMQSVCLGASLDEILALPHYKKACGNTEILNIEAHNLFTVKPDGDKVKAVYHDYSLIYKEDGSVGGGPEIFIEYTLADGKTEKVNSRIWIGSEVKPEEQIAAEHRKYIPMLRRAVIEAGYGQPAVDLPRRCEWHTKDGAHVYLYTSKEGYEVNLEIKADSLYARFEPKIKGWEDLL